MITDDSQPASYWRSFIVPLLIIGSVVIMLAPTPTVITDDGTTLLMRPEAQRLIAVVFLMAGLWLTQVIPLAATSLLPLALFPLLGIQSAEDVSRAFVDDMLFLFIGGFIIALGIERWNLHRRIALWIVNRAGVAPKQLVLGMMLATALLSMWISNTATTLMMLPIALALLKITNDVKVSRDADSSERIAERLTAPMLLGIAYAASIGGMTTIVGTPTNATAVGIYQDRLPDAPEISIAQWMIVSVPLGIVYLGIVWLVLTWRLPRQSGAGDELQQELKSRLERLGPISRPEGCMIIIFAATALLWIFRRPLEFGDVKLLPGWSQALPSWFSLLGQSSEIGDEIKKYANDSTVAILIAILMFFIPSARATTQDDALLS